MLGGVCVRRQHVSVVLPVAGGAACFCALLSLYCARCTEPGLLPVANVEGETTAGGFTKKVVVLDGEKSELVDHRAKYVRETGNVVEKFGAPTLPARLPPRKTCVRECVLCCQTISVPGSATVSSTRFRPRKAVRKRPRLSVGAAVVGRRNYRHFVLFLTMTNLLSIAVLATTVVTVMAKGRDFEDGFGGYLEDHADGLVMVGLIVYTAIIVLCVGGLWMYHLRLLCENKTTNEDIKQTYDRYNPHDQGCCGNCSEVLCSKVRPSHFSAPTGSAEGP